MIINYKNLENIKYVNHVFRWKKSGRLIYIKECLECSEEFLGRKESIFCCRKCQIKNVLIRLHSNPEVGKKISKTRTGHMVTQETRDKISKTIKETGNSIFMTEQNPKWKGGVTKLDCVSYDNYYEQLNFIDECRRDPENLNILQVRCTYCGSWLIPTRNQVCDRVKSLNNIHNHQESRFYCSEGCKTACPIYRAKIYPNDFKPYISREVQPQLRKMVLSRDNYICQKCDISLEELRLTGKTLHCHHIDPVINNPIESADVDNCITVCEDCHRLLHKIPGCSSLQC